MSTIIHRKPPYRVYIEEGPNGARAHVAELPGCFTRGSTAAMAAGLLPKAIVGFLSWLRAHREPLVPEAYVARPSTADLFIAEVHGADMRGTLFAHERAAWSDEKLERTLRWLSYSRTDLLARIAGLDDAELRGRKTPAGQSFYALLEQIAAAELGYAAHSSVKDTAPDGHKGILDRLTAARQLFVERVLAVPPSDRGEPVFESGTDGAPEAWTVQKAVRVALERERELLEVL